MKPFSIALEIFREYTNNTKFIVSFLFSLIFLFSGLLCHDHRASALKNDNEVLGYITYKTRTIKRRSDSAVVWYDVENRQPLTRRDTIRAEELSNAVVTLNDGTELRIGENSMVVLDFSGKSIKLDFKYGSIQSRRKGGSDSKLEIISGGTKVDLKNGDLSLNKKENEGLKVFAERGQAVFQQGDEKIELVENQILEAKENAKPTLRQAEIILAEPESMKVFSVKNSSKLIFFNWKNTEKESRLEISKDSDFLTLHHAKDSKTNSSEVSLSLGSYYWRVRSKSGISESRKLTLVKETELTILSPQEKQEISYSGNPPIVSFSWNHLEDVRRFTVEISDEFSIKKILKKFESRTNSISTDSLQVGKYYCRVKAEFNHPDLPAKYSEVRSFTVTETPVPPAPVLLSPKDGLEINHKEKILLNWKAAGYDYFRIRLSAKPDFSSTIIEKNVTDNYLSLPDLENNTTYYWQLEGTAGKLNQKILSGKNSFTVREKVNKEQNTKSETDDSLSARIPEYFGPVLSEPKPDFIAEEGKIKKLTFKWKKQKAELSYTLYIYKKTEEGEYLHHKETSSSDFIILNNESKLIKGEYAWILEAEVRDKDKKRRTKKSIRQKYTILPALTPPKIKNTSDVYYLEE